MKLTRLNGMWLRGMTPFNLIQEKRKTLIDNNLMNIQFYGKKAKISDLQCCVPNNYSDSSAPF